MFTQKCFIKKNTKELRIKLDKLGYENIIEGEKFEQVLRLTYDLVQIARTFPSSVIQFHKNKNLRSLILAPHNFQHNFVPYPLVNIQGNHSNSDFEYIIAAIIGKLDNIQKLHPTPSKAPEVAPKILPLNEPIPCQSPALI